MTSASIHWPGKYLASPSHLGSGRAGPFPRLQTAEILSQLQDYYLVAAAGARRGSVFMPAWAPRWKKKNESKVGGWEGCPLASEFLQLPSNWQTLAEVQTPLWKVKANKKMSPVGADCVLTSIHFMPPCYAWLLFKKKREREVPSLVFSYHGETRLQTWAGLQVKLSEWRKQRCIRPFISTFIDKLTKHSLSDVGPLPLNTGFVFYNRVLASLLPLVTSIWGKWCAITVCHVPSCTQTDIFLVMF